MQLTRTPLHVFQKRNYPALVRGKGTPLWLDSVGQSFYVLAISPGNAPTILAL